MKMMIQELFGIKKLEKEIKTGCHQDKPESNTSSLPEDVIISAAMETIVLSEMHTQHFKKVENI